MSRQWHSLEIWTLEGINAKTQRRTENPIDYGRSRRSIEYPYATAEPQKTGLPLTPEEKANVIDQSEHKIKPGDSPQVISGTAQAVR